MNIQSLKRRVAGMGLGSASDVPALAADKILSVPKSGSSLAVELLAGPGRVVDVQIEQQMERRVPAAGTCGEVWIKV